MTPTELAIYCNEAIKRGETDVILKLGRKVRGKRARLCKGGPMGVVVDEHTSSAMFNAREIIAMLHASGVVCEGAQE